MAPEDESDDDSTEDDSRSQGIELGDLDDDLAAHDYPVSASTLVDEYGDREIELPGGTQRVEEVLGLYDEDDDQEFGDAEAVRTAIHNLVGSEAVGRDNYSDRGGSSPEEATEEDESF